MRSRALILALVVVGLSLLATGIAGANCHIATWDSNRVRVPEGAGSIELFIELDGKGPVTCTGSVTWKTVDRSANAPEDYTASSGEASWKPGSDRKHTIKIPIIDDAIVEPLGETFDVTMATSPGGISVEKAGPNEGGPTVAVFIADNDGTPSASVSTSPRATTRRVGGGNSGLLVGLVAGLLAMAALASILIRRRGTRQ